MAAKETAKMRSAFMVRSVEKSYSSNISCACAYLRRPKTRCRGALRGHPKFIKTFNKHQGNEWANIGLGIRACQGEKRGIETRWPAAALSGMGGQAVCTS